VSPSWRDRAAVFVSPACVRLRVRPRGWRAREGEAVEIPVGAAAAPGDCPEASALAQALAGRARAGFDAAIVLSNQYVRYAMVEDAGALDSAAMRSAAARQALHSIYGEAAADWDIVMQQGADGGALVAGAPRALLAALRAACLAAGARRLSVQPLLVACVNDAARDVGEQAGWLGVLESGRMVLASLADDGIAAVRTQRVAHDASAEIAAMIERARVLDGSPAARKTVLLASDVPQAVVFAPESGLRLQLVQLACALQVGKD
jgi:hypothetical protein